MSLRILHLIRVDSIGGAERTLISGLPALNKTGVSTGLCILDACHEDNPLPRLLPELEWHAIQDRGRPHIRTFWRVHQIARKGRFDCIHTHGYRAAWYGVCVAKHLRIPIVATRHGLLSRHFRERLIEHSEAALMTAFDGVICVAPHLAQGIRTNTQHIPNAVALAPIDEIRWPATQPTQLLYVGRFSQEKNLLFLLEALVPLFQQHPALKLDMVGSGPTREAIQRYISEHKLAGQVALCGFQDDPRPFYKKADILLLSSLREGLPLVALEAMAHGTPVVATAVGALPTLLQGQPPHGLLIPPNDVQAYTEGVAALLEHAGMATTYGKKSYQHVAQHYGLMGWARSHKAFYNQYTRERTSA